MPAHYCRQKQGSKYNPNKNNYGLFLPSSYTIAEENKTLTKHLAHFKTNIFSPQVAPVEIEDLNGKDVISLIVSNENQIWRPHSDPFIWSMTELSVLLFFSAQCGIRMIWGLTAKAVRCKL